MLQKKKSKKIKLIKPVRSGQVPATNKMLSEVRSELKADITSVKLEIRALSKKMDARFAANDSRFASMDAKLEKVIAAIHRTNAIVEEQNARNKVVLDGYDQIYRRQAELEK